MLSENSVEAAILVRAISYLPNGPWIVAAVLDLAPTGLNLHTYLPLEYILVSRPRVNSSKKTT